jgi:hypothetical protein
MSRRKTIPLREVASGCQTRQAVVMRSKRAFPRSSPGPGGRFSWSTSTCGRGWPGLSWVPCQGHGPFKRTGARLHPEALLRRPPLQLPARVQVAMRVLSAFFALAAFALGSAASTEVAKKLPKGFATTNGTQFSVDGQPFVRARRTACARGAEAGRRTSTARTRTGCRCSRPSTTLT